MRLAPCAQRDAACCTSTQGVAYQPVLLQDCTAAAAAGAGAAVAVFTTVNIGRISTGVFLASAAATANVAAAAAVCCERELHAPDAAGQGRIFGRLQPSKESIKLLGAAAAATAARNKGCDGLLQRGNTCSTPVHAQEVGVGVKKGEEECRAAGTSAWPCSTTGG